jgi:maltooligosyltrehalose trehalohydrolase
VRVLYRELLRLRATEPALKERGRGSYDARELGPDALLLERRGAGQWLLVLVNVRGRLEHRLPEGSRAEVVLWSESPRFGGSTEAPPLREGMVRLEGPSALVVRLTR